MPCLSLRWLSKAGLPGRQSGVDGGEGGAEDFARLANQDALEECLVEQAALQGGTRQIGSVWRLGLGQGFQERRLDVLSLHLCCLKQPLSLALLGFQALLLAGENLIGDEPLIGELHKAALVVLETLDLAAVTLNIPLDDLCSLIAVTTHIGPNGVPHLSGEANGAV